MIVHPSGLENSIHRSIDALESCHGDKRGRSFRVWLDKVLVSAIGLDSWLVKFDKWELNGTISSSSFSYCHHVTVTLSVPLGRLVRLGYLTILSKCIFIFIVVITPQNFSILIYL